MKIALWLTFFASPSLLSQEFSPPSERDLMAVSFNFLEESKKVISKVPEKDCDNEKEKEKIVEPPKTGEIYCLCEVKAGLIKDESILTEILGEYDSELTINTGNDNLMHGLMQRIGGRAKAMDGDDRGRTFNGTINYNLLGTDGELKLSLDSTGFGRFSKLDKKKRSRDGKYDLVFHELNTLDVRLDKNFKKSEDEKSYWIGEFKFTNETDEGKYSRAVQEWWHTVTKENMGMNVIQYRYLKEKEDRNTMSFMVGAGKEWIKNIGNWKCQTRLEAKAGFSSDLSGSNAIEASVRAENKLSHSSLPWLALSTWVEASTGFMGSSKEGGIILSAEKKFKKVIVRPFIGVERHITPMDKNYGTLSGNPYEAYHVLGVTIKY